MERLSEKSGSRNTVGFLMLYRRTLDRDSLIYRDICGGGLGAVKKDNQNIDGFMGAKPEVQYGVVLA